MCSSDLQTGSPYNSGGQRFWLEAHIGILKFNAGTHFLGDQLFVKIHLRGPPEWYSGQRHCIAVLDPVRSQAVSQLAVTRRPMRRRTIGPASSGLGEGLASQEFLVPSRSSDSCGRPGACMLTWSPGVWCFLRHIGAAGFRVKRALCQEAVRLGWVVFRRKAWLSTFATPEFARELQR